MQSLGDPEFVDNQLKNIFKFYPIAITSSYLLVLLNCYALWSVIPTDHILWWLSVATLLSMYRFILVTIRNKNSKQFSSKHWLLHNDVSSALTGMFWGYGLLFLVPSDSPAHMLIFVITVAGLISGSSSTLSLSPRSFLLFMVTCLVPMSTRLYGMSDEYGLLLFSLCYIYMYFMWKTCRRIGEDARVSIGQTISLRRQEKDLAASSRLLDLHFTGSPLGLIEWDEHLKITRWNPAASRIFGYLENETLNQKPDFLLADEAGRAYFKILRESRKALADTVTGRNKDGRAISCEWISTPLEDSNHNLLGYTSFVTDISKRLEHEQQITHQAFYDPVTDLPNRRYFHDRLRQEMSRVRRSQNHSAVLFIDLDHFKNINDSLGHALGDELLKQFAARLQKRLRQHEILARLGGDEFVVLLEELDCDLDKSQLIAAQVAKVLQALIQAPFLLENNPYTLTCSIGITLFNKTDFNENEILKQADLALYRSKHRGRNCYSFFEQEMSDHASRHLILLNNLREAIVREEFSLVFQPKVDMKTNALQGAETLLRWNNSELGSVSPAEFIPILESSTLILEVGHWVLEYSFDQLRQWKMAGLWDDKMRLAINISPRQLLDSEFVTSVTTLLDKYEVSPSMIEFEITENVLVQEVEKVSGILGRLADIGVSFSIDDFGTGYSSLSYLKQLPIDVLKIDKSFIDHCTIDGNDQAIVRSILSICADLGLTSVAEGVETQEQQQQLQLMGCDLLQGYLFSRPIPADEFSLMLSS
ncbi:MAG: EAL domain-containing protein [Oceanicoccus sp.]